MNSRRFRIVDHDDDEGGFCYGPARSNEDFRNDVEHCLEHSYLLNPWEIEFLYGIAGFSTLSPKQQTKLNIIIRKVSLGLKLKQAGHRLRP